MKTYTVATVAISYKTEFKPPVTFGGGGETPVYVRRVKANDRLQAIEKCLSDLQNELPRINCKYLSVFVGETRNPSANAFRLHPFQLDSATGQLRTK